MSLKRGSAPLRVLPRVARHSLRALGRASAGAGLLLVFVSGSLLAFVLYANLPAGRRLVAFALQGALAKTFEGSFSIEAVDRVSLAELKARGITVHDPDGHLVLSVSALSVQLDVPGLLRKLLLSSGALTLRFEHARLERAEVYLLPGKNNVPTIADAFTPSPTPASSSSATPTRTLKIWFPEIEVGHIYGRMALDGVPTLETELSAVRGSVVGTAPLTTVDVERFSAQVRGLGGADARGVGSVHVRAPGAVWTSFDGYFGDAQLGAVVRVDGSRLTITADVPRAEPAAVRALWAAYPLLQDASAHLEAQGTLHAMHTQAKLSIGKGTIASSGELRLMEHPGVDLDVSGRGLDLRALWATAPSTELDADSTVAVFQAGNEWVADVTGSTRATRILDTDLPPLDVTGSYSASNGFVAHGSLHEAGVPVKATFNVHPDGSIDGSAEAKGVELSRSPRLQPYFDGHGILDVQLKARLEKNRLVAQVSGQLSDFEYGKLSLKTSNFSGRASGPLDAPAKLSVDLNVASKRLRAGAFGFDELNTQVHGPVTRPVVSTTITNLHGPVITARTTLTLRRAPRLDGLSVEIRRDDALLLAKASQVDVEGDVLRVSGLSLEGAGGTLEASGQLSPERLNLVAHGGGLDLGIIAHALGLPSGLLSGKLALNADLDSTNKVQRGLFDLQLDQAQGDGVAIDSLSLSGQLSGSQLGLQGSAKLHDFGALSAQAQATLTGSLADARTFQRATGQLTVKAEHVPFKLLSYALPKSLGVSEVRGEGNATLVLDRSEPDAIPNLALVANTSGLFVGLAAHEKSAPAAFEGVDAHAGVNVNGQNGETDLTLKLEDQHGALLSASLHSTVDLKAALRRPEQLLPLLRATPLVAKAVIDDRALEELPGPLVPPGIVGHLRTEVSLRGTLDHPIFSDKTEIRQLRLGKSERDKAIDVCAQLDYDKSSGQYGARGEVFLPTTGSRACKGGRVAQFSAGGRAEWAELTRTTLSADPAWTGTAGLSLEGMPIDIVPSLAEAGFGGRVLGVVMFDRREALPQIRSQLEVRDAVVARTRLGTAVIQAHTDGRSLAATLQIDQPVVGNLATTQRGGQLKAEILSNVNWQGVIPSIDDTRPLAATLDARSVDAAILAPFLRDVLSEVAGKLDAQLKATLTPDLTAKAEQHWTGAVKGSLSMHDGSLQLSQLGLRMHNVNFTAYAEDHVNSSLITIEKLSAATEADKPNLAASGHIWLRGFRVENGNANVTVKGVPFLVEGVTLATLSSQGFAVDLERRPSEMFVGLTVPELEAKLPQAIGRDLIALGKNEDIEIAQPLGEPRLGAGGEALPWHMKFDLGSRVKVTRSDLFLPLSGSPEIVLGDELQIAGAIELRAGGRFSLPGLPRTFTIESGTVSFDVGGDPKDPRIQIVAACQLSQLLVRAKVSGTFRKANVTFESDPAMSQPDIEAALLNAPNDDPNATAAGIGAGAGYIGKQLLANTALSNLEIKAGSETTADQRSYSTYSAAYPLTDEIWFEGSYKNLQNQDLTGANTSAVSGTLDWRFRRNWSLRTEVGNIGTGVDLLWQYKY